MQVESRLLWDKFDTIFSIDIEMVIFSNFIYSSDELNIWTLVVEAKAQIFTKFSFDLVT